MNTKRKQFLFLQIIIAGILSTACSGMLDVPRGLPFMTNIIAFFGNPSHSGPGITLASTVGGYSVSENPLLANGTLTLTVVLDQAPTDDVTVPLSVSDLTEAAVSPENLTFTSSNWDTPQNITITGVDDILVDGNQDASLVFGPAISTDPTYNGLVAPSVGIIVMDDEGYSIVVSRSKGLITTEAGSTAKFTVVLSKAPGVNVNVPSITTNDGTEGDVDKASLTFTSINFDTPQVVTVTGQDDTILDADIDYTIQLANCTGDANYAGQAYDSYDLASPTNTVSLTNINDEVAGIVVTPIVLNLTEGGSTGSFTVYLASGPPSGNVTIDVTSGNSTRASLDKALLTFDSGNYDTPQTVTVTPVDNDTKDGTIPPITIDLAVATNYQNTDPENVIVHITDDDTPGVVVSNLSRNTTEAGQNANFTVKLLSEPSADVVINIDETYDPKNSTNQEGTIDKNTLTFTSVNWNTNQTVTVTPVDEDIDDGHKQYIIQLQNCISSDTNYSGLNPGDVTVNNLDNDTAGFTVTTATEGMVTDDMGNLDEATYSSFTVKLNSEPTANVVLNLSSTQVTDGNPSPASLTFTASKDIAGGWNMPQTVTVSAPAPNHSNADGNRTYVINMPQTTADTTYSGLSSPTVSIYSCDNDGANLTVGCRKAGGFSTSEGGGTATIWMITKDAPGCTETISASSSDTTEGQITRNNATIDNSNYNTMTAAGTNRIVVTGQDDGAIDGNIQYTVQLDDADTGTCLNYNPPDISLRNIDNEQLLEFTNYGNSSESGSTGSFGVRLAMATDKDLTFTIACNAADECAGLSVSELTFTTGNWGTYQTVTVTPVDDHRRDGTQSQDVSFGTIESDPDGNPPGNFNDYTPPGASPISNTDNDKLIWVTNYTFVGNFNANVDMSSIDAHCEAIAGDSNAPGDVGTVTYKAMIAHSSYRVATTTGTNNTGQHLWVLDPNTEYYLKTGSSPYGDKIFTTNAYGFFTFGTLTTAFDQGEFWTGLNADWTTEANNCNNWQDDDGYTARYGKNGITDSTSISYGFADCSIAAAIEKRIICVQQ